MDGDTMEQALSLIESGAILSGPEDDIWDTIFDWIANSTRTITRVVTDWIDWLWGNIQRWINRLLIQVASTVSSWVRWLWDTIKQYEKEHGLSWFHQPGRDYNPPREG